MSKFEGKILLIGGIGSGKTSLKQYLLHETLAYRKTQALEFSKSFIDSPGEYLEMPNYYRVLINTSFGVSAICVLQDATKNRLVYPPNFLKAFSKPSIGVITKIDLLRADVERARSFLYSAGVSDPVCPVSVVTGAGVNILRQYLERVTT